MQLVIEYIFEGHKRGYNFTSPTAGVDDDTLKQIWRNAMPRGQGWGNPVYLGATSLKCFPLDEDTIAVAEATVTDHADERGRKGIRRTVVEIMDESAYFAFLRRRLAAYSDDVRRRAEDKLTLCKRTNIIHKTLPRFRRDAQLVLVQPYHAADDWQVMEAFMLKLALEPVIAMRRWSPVIPFTTLALAHHDEAKMVAIPARHAESIDIAVVRLKG